MIASSLGLEVAQSELDTISGAISSGRLDLWDYLTSLIIMVAAIALGRIIRLTLRRVVDRSRTDNLLGDLIGRIVSYVIMVFGLVYAMETLGIAIGPILGALGIVGIALAFAFQDILENFVAGIILQLQRPFASGDEIVVADFEGRVTAVDTRTITLLTLDGETVRIPSAEVIKNPIVNHTEQGRRRTTIDVGVAYDTDLDFATSVLLDALADVDVVISSPPPQVFVHTFGPSSIDLAVRFWHPPSMESFWTTRHQVAVAIVKAFQDNDITIPFPQRVIHTPRPGASG